MKWLSSHPDLNVNSLFSYFQGDPTCWGLQFSAYFLEALEHLLNFSLLVLDKTKLVCLSIRLFLTQQLMKFQHHLHTKLGNKQAVKHYDTFRYRVLDA